MTTFELILLVLTCVLLVMVLILFLRLSSYMTNDVRSEDRMTNMLLELRDRQSETQGKLQKEISDGMLSGFAAVQESSRRGLVDVQDTMTRGLTGVQDTMTRGLAGVQDTMTKNLESIQGGINEKLDKSLNERLDSSFSQIGKRLESLYQSLGELKNLESGVSSLNRTLTNVKTRGIFGEMQLGNILANVLDRSQYEENVATVPGSSDRVEFAVKIPDKDGGGFLWLPVDSKFPADIYNRIQKASEEADPEALKQAQKELKDRIRLEAKTISSKYVAPPATTDFAIMFLPTEGIYSEVLRMDDLVERCQNEFKVVISGPTTLTALLNSLSIGFRYLTVNRKSEEILKILGEFRTQFGKFDEQIALVQKRLAAAQKQTEELSHRSGIVQKKLSRVESLGYEAPEESTGGDFTELSLDAPRYCGRKKMSSEADPG